MPLQDGDQFIVERGGTNYQLTLSQLIKRINSIPDTDLFAISRNSTNYKLTGAELKAYTRGQTSSLRDTDLLLVQRGTNVYNTPISALKPFVVTSWLGEYTGTGIGFSFFSKCITDSNQNMYTVGSFGNVNPFGTIKINPNGSVEWAALFNYPSRVFNPGVSGAEMCSDPSGNIFCAASTQLGLRSDYYIWSYTQSGQISTQYEFTFDGPSEHYYGATGGIAVDNSNNIYSAFDRGYLVKLNSTGTKAWECQYSLSTTLSTDTILTLRNCATDLFGNIVYVDAIGGDQYCHITKIDAAGNVTWCMLFPYVQQSSPRVAIRFLGGISIDPSGNIYVPFTLETGPSPSLVRQVGLMKIASNGTFLWARYLQTNSSTPQDGRGCSIDASGYIYLNGGPGYPVVVKYDTNGNTIWKRMFNNYDARPIATSDSYYYLVGGAGTSVLNVAHLRLDGTDTGTYGSRNYSPASFNESTYSPVFSYPTVYRLDSNFYNFKPSSNTSTPVQLNSTIYTRT
jgi:hypothetical protein